MKTLFVQVLVLLVVLGARAGSEGIYPTLSAEGELDTSTGARVCAASETLTFAPDWGTGTSCVIRDNGTVVKTGTSADAFVWTPTEPGNHLLTCQMGETVYSAIFVKNDGAATGAWSNREFSGAELSDCTLDTTEGARLASADGEEIVIDPGWTESGENDLAKVKVNGEVLHRSRTAGTFLWRPSAPGNYVFTHETMDTTYSAIFTVPGENEIAAHWSHVTAMASGTLDTTEGTRFADEEETLVYSPDWNGAASVTVKDGDTTLVASDRSGAYTWFPQGVGLHTLSHTAGGETLTAVFEITNRVFETMSGVVSAGVTNVYDGQVWGLSIALTGEPKTAEILYRLPGGDWSAVPPPLKDAGTYSVEYRVSKMGYHAFFGTNDVVILPREVTVRALETFKDYRDPDPATADVPVALDGLVAGDALDYTIRFASHADAIGTYPGVVIPEGAAEQGNYRVTYAAGPLTVFASCRVTFDMGEHGVRTGGGELRQNVATNGTAVAPSVEPADGWIFADWNRPLGPITADTTIRATYKTLKADLHVDSVTNAENALSGTTVAFGWTVGNTGNPDWLAKTVEEVRLVNASDPHDVRVLYHEATQLTVPSGGTAERTANWVIPLKGFAGTWKVEVETAIDARNEYGGDNVRVGERTLAITQCPLPDLSVSACTVSPAALLPGDAVEATYTVRNGGTAAAVGKRTDALFAVKGATRVRIGSLAVDDTLAAGASREYRISATVPELIALSGDVTLFVKADANDEIVELADDDGAEDALWLAQPNVRLGRRIYLTANAESVPENAAGAVRFTVKRSGETDEPLKLGLSASGAAQDVAFPETVTVGRGASFANFDVQTVDNDVVDGDRTVLFTLTPPPALTGVSPVSQTLRIKDDEVPKLTLTFDRTDLREGEDGLTVTVMRELAGDEPLVVTLSGVAATQCGYPQSVTIPAGEKSVSFVLTAVDNDAAEASLAQTLKASAPGHVSATQTFTVADDDVPGVTLALTPAEVSEGAGVNAIYATLARANSDTVDKAITVKFDVSEAGRLIVPETVTIPAYTMSVRFAISTVDNDAVDGDAEVTITGRIRLKNGSLADPSDGQSIEQTVLITDDDVPALLLRAEPSTMKEGVDHAGDLILSHNSVLDEDLTVTLTVDVEGEIEIPETVTIPKGELSVTIPVTTLSDGVTDGGRLVSVYADDPDGGFKSASTWLQVSDVDLPDFRVEEVSVPVSVFAGKKFETTFAVSNRGFADHAGDIPFAIYLLKGANTQPSEKTKVGEGRIEGGLAAGETTELVWTLSANEATGDYRVAVVVDPNAGIGELDEADNTAYSTVISVGAPYAASAAPEKAVYLPGEDVVIAGRAVQADGVTPAAGKPVDVYVTVGGARRVWSVTTDVQGAFSHVFTPVEGEAGTYGVGAVYPGIAATTAQGAFDILGLRRTSTANVVWDIAIGDEVERTVRLQNLSGVDLTGLAVAVDGVPAECRLAHELGDVLPGNGFADLRFVATALADSPQNDYAKMTAHVTTAEGLSLSFPLYFHSKSLRAQLKATPSSIDAAMTLGVARQFEVTVRNDGRGASGPITVALPEAPYLRLVSPSTIDGLAGGESAVITFEVAPEEAHGLLLNSPLRGGRLAVNCENGTGATVALAFTPVSEATGTLVVDAIDNNTYMLASAPHLEGATVRVSNPYTGAIVASGTTGTDGMARFEGLPQGLYNIRTSAPHHATATDSVTVEPGGAATCEMFLAYQLVSATWDVVPVEIEDSYEVNLILDFETTVPAPQVKITMPGEFAEMMPGDTTAFTIHVANTGLIRADEVTLTPPAIPGHSFVFQDNGFTLAAGAARDIAVRFMRDVDDPPGPVYMDEGQWAMMTRVAWPCGKERPVYEYPTYFSYGRAVYVDPLEELVRRAQDVRTYNEPNGDGPSRDFTEGGEELDAGNMDDTDANTFVKTKGQAKVSLKLSQKITMTREAFDGTLTVYNGDTETPIRDLKLALSITDADGNACNGDNYFLKLDQGTSGGISGGFVLNGGAEIAPNDSGTAQIRFIPTRQAAETEPTVYRIGGTLTYVDPTRGELATLELVPVTITVHPSPYLKLDYFVQRDVFGDDPLTEDVVEASQPAEIAVLVRNTGTGDAKGVTIASAQPEVFRNESGLDIAFELRDYDLEAMAVDGKAAQAGLRNVTLGTIPAGESKIAQWWLLSTLSGHFLGMSGTVTPLNSWNTPDTALVDPEVGVHKLVRSFEWNGRTCFLTSEAEDDLYGRPDTVYAPDGEAEPAHLDEGATATGTLIGAETTVTVSSADVVPGWNVVSPVVDGACRYEVVSVTRGDGTELPARNCWTTDRTFVDGDEPLKEERLHVVDSLSSGAAVSWTVTLRAKPTAAVGVVSFDVVDETVENTVRDAVVVEFSAAIDPASFTAEDLVLKHQGVRVVDLQPLVLTRLTDTRYRIGGLAALASGYGRNELTVQCAGIADLNGRCGETGRAVAWLYSSAEAPYVIDVTGAPVTRVSSFDSLTTVMSVPIDERSFAGAYVTLNGRDVSDLVSFAAADAVGTRWTISGLESLQTADGDYTLALDCSSLRSVGGEGGSLTYRQSWVRDTMAPAPVSFSRTSGLGGGSCVVTMSEPVAADCISLSNFSLTHDGRSVALPATARVGRIGEAGYSLTGFESACGADGDYRLTFSADGVTDEAGNAASGSQSVSWVVNRTPPAPATDIVVSSPYGSVDSRVLTASRLVTVSATVPEDGLSVAVVARSPNGVETVLARPEVGGDRRFEAEIELPGEGNFTVLIRLSDADGNVSDAEFRVYVDGIDLEAELTGAPEVGHAAGDVELTFSEAVEEADVRQATISLTLDGAPLAVEGVTVERISASAYVIRGLDELTSGYGEYVLSVDVNGVRKASTGKLCGRTASLSWTNELVDEVAPFVVDVRLDGEAPTDEYVRMFSTVSVTFSEPVNMAQLIRKDMAGQALYVELLDDEGKTWKTVPARDVRWDEETAAVSWTVAHDDIPCGLARIVVSSALVKDMAGNALIPVDAYETIRSAKTYASSILMDRAAAAYAAPALHDWNNDGLLDLIVGELTPDGKGKVRLYLNRGSLTRPSFEDFSYLDYQDAELELSGGADLGVHVSFASARTRRMTLVAGDGRIYDWNYGFVNRKTLERVELRVREQTVADLPNYADIWSDVSGDLVADRVFGDAMGNVKACLGLGNGQCADEPLTLYANEGYAGVARIAVGDLDGDGLEDIVVGRPDGSVVFLKAKALQSQAVTFARVREVPIDEALGMDVYWKIGDRWSCEQVGTDAKAVCRIEDGGSDGVTARFEGPGTVTFTWGCEGGNAESSYSCALDDQAKFSFKGAFGTRTDSLELVGAGSHYVTWRLTGSNKAILRDVTFEPTSEQMVSTTGTSYADIRRFARSFWLQNGGDYASAAQAMAQNGRPVWENCIAGLDCDDPEARFVVSVEFDADGKPVITWMPALNDTEDARGVREGVRTYRVFGKKTLDDSTEGWREVPEESVSECNFFRVTVEMPQRVE